MKQYKNMLRKFSARHFLPDTKKCLANLFIIYLIIFEAKISVRQFSPSVNRVSEANRLNFIVIFLV